MRISELARKLEPYIRMYVDEALGQEDIAIELQSTYVQGVPFYTNAVVIEAGGGGEIGPSVPGIQVVGGVSYSENYSFIISGTNNNVAYASSSVASGMGGVPSGETMWTIGNFLTFPGDCQATHHIGAGRKEIYDTWTNIYEWDLHSFGRYLIKSNIVGKSSSDDLWAYNLDAFIDVNISSPTINYENLTAIYEADPAVNLQLSLGTLSIKWDARWIGKSYASRETIHWTIVTEVTSQL